MKWKLNLKKVKLYVPPVALIVCIIYFFYASLHKNEIVQAQEVLTMVAEKSSMKYETAIFAGGCFWSMEAPFEKLEGVLSVVSGYTGGQKENPTYAEVSSGTTGHLESVEVRYNPNQITYDQLLQVYWRNVDPTDANGQFIDRGEEYRSVIYYNSNRKSWLKHRKRRWHHQESLINRLKLKFYLQPRFTKPRKNIRTIIKKIPSASK